MGTANRVQLSACRETTIGTTPGSPRMRAVRLVKESLSFTPNFILSDELRSDRANADPIKVMQASEGSIDFELSYPDDNSPMSELFRSAFYNPWVNTPTFYNDGTADSVVTDAGTVANTYAVVSGGASVKLGHLVRATGFTNAANNKTTPFRVASSTATTIVGAALSLTAETVPPAQARLKVVGFQGAAADITTTASGLASTLLDFTTLGIVAGQWLKIDSTTTANGFATAANNDWVRCSATPTATTLPCDNLPTGWSVDAGTGKTISVYFGDQIRNGTTVSSLTFEKGFMDLVTPVYIVNTGMVVDTLSLNFSSRNKITGTASFKGMGGSQLTTTLDAVIDAATTGAVMAGNANVGRVAEAGAQQTSPSWAKELTIQIANNLRTIEALDSTSPVGINPGDCDVTGGFNAYFGDNVLLAKLYAGTASSINARVQKNSQALIFSIPRETLQSGVPAAEGKNTDVMLNAQWAASVDTAITSAQILLDRVEFYA